MPYRMRFFDVSVAPISIEAIEGAMKMHNHAYRIHTDSDSVGDLFLGDDVYAQIEINQPGDGLFEEEIEEFLEFLDDVEGKARQRVEQVLKKSKRTIAIQILGQGRESEPTLAVINPLLQWLMQTREGLLHADGEGYYDKNGLVLPES